MVIVLNSSATRCYFFSSLVNEISSWQSLMNIASHAHVMSDSPAERACWEPLRTRWTAVWGPCLGGPGGAAGLVVVVAAAAAAVAAGPGLPLLLGPLLGQVGSPGAACLLCWPWRPGLQAPGQGPVPAGTFEAGPWVLGKALGLFRTAGACCQAGVYLAC